MKEEYADLLNKLTKDGYEDSSLSIEEDQLLSAIFENAMFAKTSELCELNNMMRQLEMMEHIQHHIQQHLIDTIFKESKLLKKQIAVHYLTQDH